MEQAKSGLLRIENLVTSFHIHGELCPAVDGLNLHIDRGEIVGLVGESGCGKSMSALSVMGLVPENGEIAGGRILFKGEDLTKIGRGALRKITGDRISMIFQEPMTSLNPVKTVGWQVREAILIHENISPAKAKERVLDIFRKVGIPEPERRYNHYPHQLSGGLRQRVMIGMAMVMNPDLLIADEPTTALDVTIEAQILRLMRSLRDDQGAAILMITHNLGVVAELCDTVYVMYAGQVVEKADVFTLFREPRHPYTLGLMGSLPRTDKHDRSPLKAIPGMVPSLSAMPSGCRFAPRCEHACAQCRESTPPLTDLGNGHEARCFFCDKGGDGQ